MAMMVPSRPFSLLQQAVVGLLLTLTLLASLPSCVAHAASSSTSCGSGAGIPCSLNGDCIDGECLCDKGWKGDDCSVLNFQRTPSWETGIGVYVAPESFSSWGMTVVQDRNRTGADGSLYHGFVSEFMYGCDLDAWGTNSYINHVVAPSPMGPWTQHERGAPASLSEAWCICLLLQCVAWCHEVRCGAM